MLLVRHSRRLRARRATVAAIALLAIAPAPAEAPDTILVPGGIAAVSRFLGHVDPAPDRFVDSVNRVLLRRIRRDLDATRIDDRVRMSSYLDEVAGLRARFGDDLAFDPGEPDARARFEAFLGYLGYEVDRAGLPEIRETEAGDRADARRRVAEALGWNVRAAAHELADGRPVRLRVPVDAVPSPLPFSRWTAIAGSAPTAETAFAMLVGDVATSSMLEGLRRLPPTTRERLDDAALAAIRAEAPVEFERYASAFDSDADGLVPPGGRATVPAWNELLFPPAPGTRRRGSGPGTAGRGAGAGDPGEQIRTLLVEDGAIGAHLWHALAFATPTERAFFLEDSPEGRRRRARLRGVAEHLLALGGADTFRSGLVATVSAGEAIRKLDARQRIRALDPAVAEALTTPRIGPACASAERAMASPRGSGEDETVPLRLLEQARRAERRHDLPFGDAARVMEVLERAPALATPATVVLLRRAARDRPDVLDVVRGLAPDEPDARAYLLAVERLDCELPSETRTRAVKTFQGGVILAVEAHRHGAIDRGAASAWLGRWAALWRTAPPGTAPRAEAAEAIRALVVGLDEPAPAAEGRGPLERRALAAIAGPRPATPSFVWDDIAYGADPVADRTGRMVSDLTWFGVATLDDALVGGGDPDALTSWLVTAAYLPTFAPLADRDFRQRGWIERHRLEEPAYGGPDSVPLMSGWRGCRLAAAVTDEAGAHLVGSLHGVPAALVRHAMQEFDPWRPPHTWIDTRPWMVAALASDWDALGPETFALADVALALGAAIEARGRGDGDAGEAAALVRAVVPPARLPIGRGGNSRVSPSERFSLGRIALERRAAGTAFPGWLPRDLASRADAALAAAGGNWTTALDAVGAPTPETDGRVTPAAGPWAPYEAFQDDLVARELRERMSQDLFVTVAAFAGRRGLPGTIARDVLMRAVERVPEKAAVASERDWESFVRWIATVDDAFLEECVRECLVRGTYRARLDTVTDAPGGSIEFVAPRPGAPLLGRVEFRLEVDDPAVRRVDLFVGDRRIGSAVAPDWTLAWDADRAADGRDVIALARDDDGIVGRGRLVTGRVGRVDHVRVDLVQLYPVVHSLTGEYVRDLAREDFEVRENGVPVEIRHFDAAPSQLSLALVLDVSRSMADKLGRVVDASVGFAESLGENDAVALYAFNHRLERIVPLTRDRRRLREGIWSLPCAGGTALYDALVRVVDDLRDVPGRKAIFVFSDGLDELSLTSLADAVRAATGGEILIYATGIVDALPTGKPGREDLDVLARSTGGESHFILFADELPKIYRRVREHLLAQYAVGYVPAPGPAGVRTLEVRVRHPSMEVHARRSYEYVREGRQEDAP